MEALVRKLNDQKNFIKKNGMLVDGKQYKIKFTGIIIIIIIIIMVY